MNRILVVLALVGVPSQAPEACDMAQKPVAYPGAVLSRNSQMRAQALQGAAYAQAAAASPSTLGFMQSDQVALDNYRDESGALNREAIAGRVHGYLDNDVVVGYAVTWWGTRATGGSTSVLLKVATYFVDDNGQTLKMVPGSLVAQEITTTGSFTKRGDIITVPPFELPRDAVLVAGASLTSTPADWNPGEIGLHCFNAPAWHLGGASVFSAYSPHLSNTAYSDVGQQINIGNDAASAVVAIPSIGLITKRNTTTTFPAVGIIAMPL